MTGAWVRVTVLLALLTLAASDRALTLWAGACAAALALGGVLLGFVLDALAVSQALRPAEVFAGETLQVFLRVTNRSVVPLPALQSELGLARRLGQRPLRWLVSLPAGETLETVFSVCAARRGVYHMGSVALEAGDWFGLWRRQATVDAPLWLTVFPRPLAPALLPPPPRRPAGDLRQPASPFRAWEPAGLREYRRGDPPRWIAWKASAHRGELVVREFPPVRDRAHLILLDLRPSAWPESGRAQWVEHALSLAAAWTLRAAERDEPVGLFAWGALRRYRPEDTPSPSRGAPGGSGHGVPSSLGAEMAGAAARGTVPAPVVAAPPAMAWVRDGVALAIDLPARAGPRHRRALLGVLALLEGADGPVFTPAALRALRASPGSSVLWVAGCADDDSRVAASAAARAGHAVALAVVPSGQAGAAVPGVAVWPLELPREVEV